MPAPWASEIPGPSGRRKNTLGSRSRTKHAGSVCACGAWYGELGDEPTHLLFVEHIVEVFRAVRRVLHSSGTLWVNMGDSYAGGSKGGHWDAERTQKNTGRALYAHLANRRPLPHLKQKDLYLKQKDLLGMPWRVAFALQDDGWYLRSDIIWSKPNPMPESIGDRPTKAHEYIFLLTNRPTYYYNAAAIAEPVSGTAHARGQGLGPKAYRHPTGWDTSEGSHDKLTGRYPRPKYNPSFSAAVKDLVTTRNKRDVWTVPSYPYPDAHFATFPPALIEPCILAGSRVGDTVLDPFGGSGTTAMVATQHRRDAILCELNPDYCALIQKRLDGVQVTLPWEDVS